MGSPGEEDAARRARRYMRLSAPLRSAPWGARALRAFNRATRVVFYLAFPCAIAVLLWRRGVAAAVFVAAVLGAGFLALTAVRSRIDAPRPYEELDIEPLLPPEREGRSFPSRHLFSCAAISACWMGVSLSVAAALLALTAAEAAVRVVGGVHYLRDVVVGVVCGTVVGALALAAVSAVA